MAKSEMPTNVVESRTSEPATVQPMPRGRRAGPAEGIGIIWRQLRTELGLSPADVERECGVSDATVQSIENGTRTKPGHDVLGKVGALYKVAPDVLMFDPTAEMVPHLKSFVGALRARWEAPDPVQRAKLNSLERQLGHVPTRAEYEIWWGLISQRIGPTSDRGSKVPDASEDGSPGAGASPDKGGGRGR